MSKILSTLKKKARLLLRAFYISVSKAGARSMADKLEVKSEIIESLRERLTLSHKQNQRLHQRNLKLQSLQEHSVSLISDKSGYASIHGVLADLRRENAILHKNLHDAEFKAFPLTTSASPARIDRLISANENLKAKLKTAITFNKSYGVLMKYIAQEHNLNTNAFQVVGERRYDYVIAHDILGIAAARSLADHYESTLIVDIVEEYDLLKRSGAFFRKNLSQSEAIFINTTIRNLLLTANDHLHIGPMQLDKFLKNTGKKGKFLPNFRNRFISSPEIQAEADAVLESHDFKGKAFVCVPNRIMNVKEITLLAGAMAKAKHRLPILHIGAPLEENVAIEVEAYCQKKNIKLIQLGLLSYDVYREILSRAQYCSFLTLETVFNARYAFPNRLFDAISTRTPILVGGFVQVGEFVEKKKIGVYLDTKLTITDLAQCITRLNDNKTDIQSQLQKQSKLCSWDSVFNKSFKDIKSGERILIITRKDVRANQRIRNLQASFIKKGCEVTVIGGHATEYDNSKREFFTIPLTRPVTESELYDLPAGMAEK